MDWIWLEFKHREWRALFLATEYREYRRGVPPASAKQNPEELVKWALSEFAKLEQTINMLEQRIKALEA